MIDLKFYKLFMLITGILAFQACSSSDSTSSDDDDDDDDVETTYLISENLFNSDSLISFETITSTLEDGTTAECFQITFSSNPLENVGPFCPETINDTAGLGFYDGETNPGLRVWSEDLLNDIEADGYDMVNDDGTVNVDYFDSTTDPDLSYCLEAPADDDLQMVFIIPSVPKLANSNNDIEEVEIVGLSLDGIPTNGEPPSAINGPVQFTSTSSQINFPSIDPCGGHHDPAGYYHWHLIPQVANQVLTENGVTEVSCTNITQTDDVELFGFAKDGYPIYAYATEPDDLDDCGGRTATTDEYPDGTYHYVASTTTAPNIPACLKGVSASNSFQYR
jgi:hypothetical protein